MKDELPQFADDSLRAGWLELMSAGPGFSYDLRVPGTEWRPLIGPELRYCALIG